MPVRIVSTGGGGITLSAASTGSEFTATLPANTGTVVTTASSAAVTPAMLTQPMTLGTAQASTSGTSIDFTGIPSWARRVTVIFNGVSTTGTSPFLVQLGSGSVTTSGYTSVGSGIAATVNSTTSTAGFVAGNVNTAASLASGLFVFVNVSGTTWAGSGSVSQSAIPQTNLSTGNSPALSGALDRVRITTVGGTDTFDAGSINILYEG